MEYFKSIFKAVFILLLLAVTYILYAIFGRREMKKIPQDMEVLCTNPLLRYFIYALGVILMVFVIIMQYICYVEGGYDNPDNETLIYSGICLLEPLILFVCGYILYAKRVFFNNDYLIICRPFRTNARMNWYEIRKMVVKKHNLKLYDQFGRLCFDAVESMENYQLFYIIAEEHLKSVIKK